MEWTHAGVRERVGNRDARQLGPALVQKRVTPLVVDAEDPDGHGLRECLEAALALAQRVEHAVLLGDVARDHHDAHLPVGEIAAPARVQPAPAAVALAGAVSELGGGAGRGVEAALEREDPREVVRVGHLAERVLREPAHPGVLRIAQHALDARADVHQPPVRVVLADDVRGVLGEPPVERLVLAQGALGLPAPAVVAAVNQHRVAAAQPDRRQPDLHLEHRPVAGQHAHFEERDGAAGLAGSLHRGARALAVVGVHEVEDRAIQHLALRAEAQHAQARGVRVRDALVDRDADEVRRRVEQRAEAEGIHVEPRDVADEPEQSTDQGSLLPGLRCDRSTVRAQRSAAFRARSAGGRVGP